MRFQLLKDWVMQRLENELSADLKYHNAKHTRHVERAVISLAKGEGIKGDELITLKTAAILHDTGFLYQYHENEVLACELAEKLLPKYEYSEQAIKCIKQQIMATKMPQYPKDQLSKVLCDADLYYLGTADYYEISNLYREELALRGTIFSEKAWLDLQIDFLKEHSYFTETAKATLKKGKQQHLKELLD